MRLCRGAVESTICLCPAPLIAMCYTTMYISNWKDMAGGLGESWEEFGGGSGWWGNWEMEGGLGMVRMNADIEVPRLLARASH